MFEHLHLGDERPSQIIRPGQFLAELVRLLPTLHDDPRRIEWADYSAHYDRAQRAGTAAIELMKFLPESADTIPDDLLNADDRARRARHSEQYSRAWLERQRARGIARVDRIIADYPRIWALRSGGKLCFPDELSGLFNQITTAGLPTLGDLRDYLAERAKSILVAGPTMAQPAWSSEVHTAADIFVEIDSEAVIGIHLWDNGAGPRARVVARQATLEDFKDGIFPFPMPDTTEEPVFSLVLTRHPHHHRIPIEVEHERRIVKAVTIHFDCPHCRNS